MMSRLRNKIDAVQSHVRSLWIIIGVLVLLNSLLFIGWKTAPSRLTVFVPPQLDSGATFAAGSIPNAQIYAFAYYIFQVLNHWPSDGAKDYPANIIEYSPYLTPAFLHELKEDAQDKDKNGELQSRTQTVQGKGGAAYDENNVTLLADGSWQVNLIVEEEQTLEGMTIHADTFLFVLHVVRYDVDREKNPWGLALAGFLGEPQRLSTTTLNSPSKVSTTGGAT